MGGAHIGLAAESPGAIATDMAAAIPPQPMVSSYRVRFVLCALMCIGAGAGACSDATGTVTGGEGRFDAQPPEMPATGCPSGKGTTWTDLYRDYFGPGSKGSCSGATGDENNCHLSSSAAGALASNGYVCGPSKDSCFMSFKDVLVPPMRMKAHYFEAVLRQDPPVACPPACVSPMPLRPASAVFCGADLGRIRKWADNGAKND